MERHWERGHPRRLEEYQSTFPSLFEDRDLLNAMAYEEFRLRLQAGEGPTPAEYHRRFGLESRDWPGASSPSPRSSEHAASSVKAFPPGDGAAEMGQAAGAYLAYRRQLSERPESLDSLLESFRVPASHAELLRSLDRTDPHKAERLADALTGLPRVGGDFLGFRLSGELGRGAFARVFLARQGGLADRLVALKVSADVAGESHALARLQHTNVVPIYSVHRRGSLQAVCMPYLGATTLADTLASVRSQAALPNSGEGLLSSLRSRKVSSASAGREKVGAATVVLEDDTSETQETGMSVPPVDDALPDAPPPPQVERLRGLGYVPAVLWIAARVADGLAHAHERGILHRDLKPANILFSDDGEPVLLDFNLAAETNARAGAAVALVGGTLPYMAPEQLSAFRKSQPSVDPRSDVYSLGVILYELLTGAHPFPIRNGELDTILPEMIADRLASVADVRGANPVVSPAVASIVRHCLESDPARRYASARELQEDLARQLDHRPLLHAPDPSVARAAGQVGATAPEAHVVDERRAGRRRLARGRRHGLDDPSPAISGCRGGRVIPPAGERTAAGGRPADHPLGRTRPRGRGAGALPGCGGPLRRYRTGDWLRRDHSPRPCRRRTGNGSAAISVSYSSWRLRLSSAAPPGRGEGTAGSTWRRQRRVSIGPRLATTPARFPGRS